MKRDVSRLQGLKIGSQRPRLRYCATTVLAAVGLSACSSSEPPTTASLVEPIPPAAASSRTMAPKMGANPAVSASEAPPARVAPGQIAGFRSSTVILYSSDVGADGKKVAVSTLSLPTPIVAMSSSKQRLAIHTAEGIRWVAISEVAMPAQPPATPVATVRKANF